MSLKLSEEQTQLHDTMRGWFSEKYSLVEVRKVFESKRNPLTIADLTELGLTEAFTFDESGWGLTELGIVAFEAGYGLVPSSVYLDLLGSNAIGMIRFDKSSNSNREALIDRTQGLTLLTEPGEADKKQTEILSLLANEAAGVCARAIEITKEYIATRKQFGKPIGTFQAVQHKLADLFVLAESLRTSAAFATWSGSNSIGQFLLASTAAATLASEITPKVIEGCIQLHGGIGFTWEHDLHLFLRRAKVLQTVLKPSDARISTLLSA